MSRKITTILCAVFITTTSTDSIQAETKETRGQRASGGSESTTTAGLDASLKKLAENTGKRKSALNAKYIKALERLKAGYKSNDRLEDALATVNEIHSVTGGEGDKPTPIPPSATALLKARQTYERELGKIRDLADVTYIRTVEKQLALLKSQVRHTSTSESAKTVKSIENLQSNKRYKAAVSRHKAYLALTGNSKATKPIPNRRPPTSLATFR